jgi:O-antigen/teichoic acid export membrane protein
VMYVLALVVAFNAGTATSRIVLKGTERHQSLALWSVVLAVSNLALSIALAPSFGLIGVALGTLIPVVIITGFVMFPAACRRVDLPVWVALRRAVWPAIWPAVVPCGVLLLLRDAIGTTPIFIAIAGVAAGLLYAASFLSLAIRRDERQWYLQKVSHVLGWPRMRLA